MADAKAHRVAWHRFSSLVRRMVRRACRHRVDCEDIVQDVFCCLFRRVHTLRDPVALRGFVIGVTLRTMSFEVRKRRARFRLTVTGTDERIEMTNT